MHNKIKALILLIFAAANVAFIFAFPDSTTNWLNAGAAVICFGTAIIIGIGS